MIATGQLAFANVRVRVRRATLLGPERARPAGPPAPAPGFIELADWYRVILSDYPGAAPLWLALLRRHEIENVKLVWRAAVRGHATNRWARLWRPLGRLEAIGLEAARQCASAAALVERLQATPYAGISAAMLRTHAADLLAIELGLDRWVSRAIADAAEALGPSETLARALALGLVGERDLEWLRRGARAFGLTPDAVVSALVYLPRTCPAAMLAELAGWRPGDGPFRRALPRPLARAAPQAGDWDGLLLAWRDARGAGCRRAFAGQPFCLAPAVALLLLKEQELRALASAPGA